MALSIQPEAASVRGGDAVAFLVRDGDAAVAVTSWELAGAGELRDGVFISPRVGLESVRSVVTARTAAGSVSAEIVTSAGHNWIALLTAYFAVVLGACVWGIFRLWTVDMTKTPEGWVFLLISALCGALGACLHGINSLAAYVGAKQFQSSWSLYYLARPAVGGILGPMVFLVFRSNLVGDAQTVATGDWLTVAALTSIAGLFADKTVEKLKHVMEVLFSTPKDERPNKLGESGQEQGAAAGQAAGGQAAGGQAAGGQAEGGQAEGGQAAGGDQAAGDQAAAGGQAAGGGEAAAGSGTVAAGGETVPDGGEVGAGGSSAAAGGGGSAPGGGSATESEADAAAEEVKKKGASA